MNKRGYGIGHARERGIALIVGLLILVVFSLIGISAMNTTLLQERMAGSYQASVIAFNASESGLRAGEDYMLDLPCPPPDPSSTSSIYEMENVDVDHEAGVVQNFWYNHAWPSGVGQTPSFDFAGFSGAEMAENPRYVIELLPPVSSRRAEAHGGISGTGDVSLSRYRITARGTGSSGNEYVLTQSTFILDCIF